MAAARGEKGDGKGSDSDIAVSVRRKEMASEPVAGQVGRFGRSREEGEERYGGLRRFPILFSSFAPFLFPKEFQKREKGRK